MRGVCWDQMPPITADQTLQEFWTDLGGLALPSRKSIKSVKRETNKHQDTPMESPQSCRIVHWTPVVSGPEVWSFDKQLEYSPLASDAPFCSLAAGTLALACGQVSEAPLRPLFRSLRIGGPRRSARRSARGGLTVLKGPVF